MTTHSKGWFLAALVAAAGATAWAGAECCGHEKAGDKAAEPVAQASATETAQPGKPQTLCPVMNVPINRNLYVDHEGKRLYVCCGSCVRKVKADPARYVRQLEAQGIELEKVPAPSS